MNITFEEFVTGIKSRSKHKRMVMRLPSLKSSIPNTEPDAKELEAIEKANK